MAKVVVEDGAVRVDGRAVHAVMGEVHYWRLAPARWREVLRACRRLGVGMIATYVPWQYHEVARGEFDFDGRTEGARDVVGFLGLCAAEGFRVFIRPGPYIYSEWTNAGVPDRVVTLARCSEEYCAEARVWMRAVTDVLRPYLATSVGKFAGGGPIVLFQADNETDCFTHWFEGECGLDRGGTHHREHREHREERTGSGVEAGGRDAVFQEFLRETYGAVGALNEVWGTGYARLEDPRAAAVVVDRFSAGERARARDYWRFQHWLTARTLKWHVEEYRRLGVDLPIVANYYPGGDVQNWRVLADESGADVLGIDWYPRNEFAGPPAAAGMEGQATGGGGIFGLPARREHRVFLDSCRYQRAVSRMPFVAEMECGVWHGYHGYTGAFSAGHYRLLACSALLAGIRGWNWYMLVGRDNWYYTPINERGEMRGELAPAFMDIHRVVREIEPATLEKVVRVGAYFCAEQIGTDDALANNAVLQGLYDAGIDVEIVDAETLNGGPRVVFYAGADWLSREEQGGIAAWVEGGGTLVLLQNWPRADERFRAHDGLGVRGPDGVLSRLGKKVAVELGGVVAEVEGAVWVWDEARGEAIVGTQVAGRQRAIENADRWMARYVGKRWTVGYREKRGKGEVVVIGLAPNGELVRAAHEWVAGAAAVRSEVSGVQTALLRRRKREEEMYVVAANMSGADVMAGVRLGEGVGGARVRVTDVFDGWARVADRDDLFIRLRRASGSVFRVEGVGADSGRRGG